MSEINSVQKADLDPRTAWARFCAFLDQPGAEFANTQGRLLKEQIKLIAGTAFGAQFMRGKSPSSVDEFRRTVQLTNYESYGPLLRPGTDAGLADSHVTWAYTVYGPGNDKWIPYTTRAYEQFLDGIMSSLLVAAAVQPAEVRVRPGDRVMYNVPPRPFIAGMAAFGLSERFGVRGVLDPAYSESLDFKTRVESEFKQALRDGVDIIISMSSVLLKVGERFEQGSSSRPQVEPQAEGLPRPNLRAIARMVRAKAISIAAGQPVRPRDLWRAKAIVGWGLDTRFLRDQIGSYWGRPPFEMYASTEGGVMGVQPGAGSGMVLYPESNFYEFIPESEVDAARMDPAYTPRTVLPDEVEPGGRYEVVITNFHGMPLLRYRMGHIVRFTSTAAPNGRQFEYVGRSDERIDIAGFTRIDEATVWKAMVQAGVPFREWTLRREESGVATSLHLYGEATRPFDPWEAQTRLHEALKQNDPLYRDLELMLGIRPLSVTVLPPGTFDRYYEVQRRAGVPLTVRRPSRMNASDAAVATLLSAAADEGQMAA